MKIINPKKYIRKAIIDALPDYAVFDTSVPIDSPYPDTYITIDNINLSPTEVTKTCFEWHCDLYINLWQVQEKGFASSVSVEDMEEDVLNAVFNPAPFRIKDIRLIESKPMNVGHVQRIVMILRFWVDVKREEIE